ncbi:5'-nucleotidase C-terminal domain-containing protein [Rhodosalinus sp. FB01]|uniref:5'-nucleotidase C-terminal domain-containing protein n=1 Tax=Rhodosalinus sp. FB01 TaxID=3239194 RepID=UPI003526790B
MTISFAPLTLAPGMAQLRILAPTDLHCTLLGHDYARNAPVPRAGLAALGPLIRRLRAEVPGTLLLDNGDTLQGTPLADHVAENWAERGGAPHPAIAAMTALGYDAATLGNHDFDYGLAFLRNALAGAGFPVVLANFADAGGTPLLPPYTLIDRELRNGGGGRARVRVGVIGFAPPQTVRWSGRALAGAVRAACILDSARRLVPRMRADGADVVVALAHSGLGERRPAPRAENVVRALAAVPGLDAVIAGHSHAAFPPDDTPGATLAGIPAVMPDFLGKSVGVIDLVLERRSTGGWRVAAHRARRVAPTGGEGEDAAVLRAAARDHGAAQARLAVVAGATSRPLHSHFALLTDAPALRLLAEAQRAAAERGLAGTRWAGLPLLSAVAPSKAGGPGGPGHFVDIPAGPLHARHLSELFPFGNALQVVRLSGAALLDWLERAAALYRTLRPGVADQPLLQPDFPTHRFDVLHGLSYRIDLSRPALYDISGRPTGPGPGRVDAVRHAGRPVRPADDFLVVTSAHRTGASDPPGGAADWEVVWDADLTARDALADHLLRESPVRPDPIPVWRFARLPGATALAPTGPAARAHLVDAAGLDVAETGETADGFLQLRLRL